MTVDRSFIGAGSLHLQPYDKSAPLMPMGNISEFSFSFEEEKKELKNYLGGGGVRNVVSRISGITGNITAHDFTPDNIARALRASVTATTTTAVTDEAHDTHGIEGELIPFHKLPDTGQTVTVKDSLDQTLAKGTDYTLTKSGIQVLADSGIDSNGITVSYTPIKANVIQALVESGKEFSLFMEGLNDAQEGQPYSIRVHRVKFSPVQNLGFISDDFGSIPLQLDILADTQITANGLSQFMQLDLAS